MNVSVHTRIIHDHLSHLAHLEVDIQPSIRFRGSLLIPANAIEDTATHPIFVREATKQALTEFFGINKTEHLVNQLEHMLYTSEVDNQFDMITLMHSINPILDDLKKVNQNKLNFSIDNPAQAFNPYITRYR